MYARVDVHVDVHECIRSAFISILLAIISTQKVALCVDALSECNARAYLPVLYVPECPHVHVHIHKEQ